MKYSILIPYYKRIRPLGVTLDSFVHHYKDRNDYEVVIAEDLKNADYGQGHQDLETLVSDFKDKLNIKHFMMGVETKGLTSIYNEAADKAEGKILILTSPEGFHKANILSSLDREFKKKVNIYVAYTCRHVNSSSLFPLSIAVTKKNYEELGGFYKVFDDALWERVANKHKGIFTYKRR